MIALKFRLIAILILINSGASLAQTNLWQDVTPQAKSISDTSATRYFDSDDQALRSLLNLVPGELSGQTSTIQLPMPDGSLSAFSIVESSVMEAGLAEKYPQIKTFKVYGIDDPIASGRVDINNQGFHAMLHTSQGRVFIGPDTGSSSAYRYRARSRDANQPNEPFYCSAGELAANQSSEPISSNKTANRIPGSLLTYRLAVSATKEYAIAVGGTKSLAMAEIVTAINRVNEIYELDHGIRLLLVSNNDSLIDINGTSPLNGFNSDLPSLLDKNKGWIDTQIGVNSYDIGHVFSTSNGGVARLSSVCNTTFKAQGVTGLPNPTGDMFYIDFVAHEIGHQFGANHTFNGTNLSCGGGNRNASTAVEPGSGSTIMSYAGICGAENIQNNSDATFHAVSIAQINTFVSTGGTCNAIFSFSNNEPTAGAGVDRNIPVSTPFQLNGSGTDVNGDTLSYQWDQMDTGTATTSITLGDDLGDNALFRTFVPQCATERDFPSVVNQVAGVVDKAETLPTKARNLNFRLTVRDGHTGQATDDVVLSVDTTSGPFKITSHIISEDIIQSAITEPVTWDVANTTNATVNCTNVDIDLLTFSADHSSYSVTSLLTNVPNSGAISIPIPGKSNSHARFRIKCSNNVFYDISDADLTFVGGLGPFSSNQFNSSFGATNTCNTGTVVAGGPSGNVGLVGGGGGGSFISIGSGNGIFNYLWFIFLSGLFFRFSLKRYYSTRIRVSATLRQE